MRRSFLVSAMIFSCAACHLGMRVREFEPAWAPEGVGAAALVEWGTPRGPAPDVRGELLEVREDGLLLLVPRPAGTTKRVVLLPFGLIRQAQFTRMGASCELRDGRAPTDAVRERLRRVSRFPQGLSPELLRVLLEACDQTEPERKR